MNEIPPNSVYYEIPRGVSGSDKKPDNQNFLSEEDIRNSPNFTQRDDRLLAGLIGAETLPLNAHEPEGKRYAAGGQAIYVGGDDHMFTLAASRAGKGTGSIIPNLLQYEGSVVAIDPKAELASITARHRSTLNDAVYVLDPFGKAVGEAARSCRKSFNPMDTILPHSKTRVEDSFLIADALVQTDASARDPHFDESAKQFLAATILHVATFSRYEGVRNLATVYKLIMEMESLNLEKEMSENPGEEAVQHGAEDLFSKAPRERASVISTLRRHIRFLGFKSMQEVLSHSDFSLSDLKTKRISVFLCLPAGRMDSCARWLRLFIQLSIAQMENLPQKPKLPVLFCMDEFNVLGHLRILEVAAGQIAGFGIKLWPILQNLGQLKRHYPASWETFLANSGHIEAFGVSDLTSLEWLSKRLGQTLVFERSFSSQDHGKSLQDSDPAGNTSMRSYPLLTEAEIAKIFGRNDPRQRKLIIRAGVGAFILQKPCYFADQQRFPKGIYDDPATR